MKVLLFEWLTGGGGGASDDGPVIDSSCLMQRQGQQMLAAIASDFLDAGVEVFVPLAPTFGRILPDHPNLTVIPIEAGENLAVKLCRAAHECDHVMLIAPECDGCLIECVGWFNEVARKLISPNLLFTTTASCKIATFDALHARQFTAYPPGLRLSDYLDPNCKQPHIESLHAFPLVLKRIDGAGSEQTQFISNRAAWQPQLIPSPERYRVESFITGTPVSVSVLCGEITEILAPTIQVFDRHPFGSYLHADYPIDQDISKRAIRLAEATIKALPPTSGYVGLDMVIRHDPGLTDCLIEVNPRLTLSYLTLREIYHDNLGFAMLRQSVGFREADVSSANRDCIFREPDL